jgi:hypothetical protein
MKPIKLDDIEKNSQPFSVPEGYFDDLPMKIQSRIQTEKKETWIHSPSFKVAFSVAAMMIIVMTIIFLNKAISPEEMLADISEVELLAYIDNMQIEESDILNVFNEDVEDIDFFDTEGIESLELEEESLDDLLIEYELTDDYL